MESSQEAELVRVVRVSLVQPAKPIQRHVMYLSGVDQMLRLVRPSRTLLFYRTADTDADGDPVEALRRGISAALVPYDPVAGRLVLEEDGRLAIDCNDAGVELVHAHCHELPFAELESNNFGMRKLFSQLAPMDNCERSDYLSHPLASVQVTFFKGGITVGIAMLHSIADGHGTWEFIRAIAQSCHGDPLPFHPLHGRILLKPEVFMMGAKLENVSLEDLSKEDEAPYNGCTDVIPGSSPPVPALHPHKLIHFSREMLDTLKKACLASITNKAQSMKPGFFISTYQALTAYLWKRLTMAQGVGGDDIALVDFRVSMDVRMRMTPPLTSAFFGNAVVGVPTPCTAKEIVNESLGDTAIRIRQSMEQVDGVYIRKAMIAREKADVTTRGLRKVKQLTVRNGSRFPVYEGGNFGWGKPNAVRPPWDLVEGFFTYYPGKESNSLDVIGAFTEECFTRFFSPGLYANDPLHPYGLQ